MVACAVCATVSHSVIFSHILLNGLAGSRTYGCPLLGEVHGDQLKHLCHHRQQLDCLSTQYNFVQQVPEPSIGLLFSSITAILITLQPLYSRRRFERRVLVDVNQTASYIGVTAKIGKNSRSLLQLDTASRNTVRIQSCKDIIS